MRFERLEIAGFKAFADPVELAFEDGLTGVVGPNGCGKSNLLEAIGWVMGETRPTAVRADTMDDVIFSGASSRPARGHAEVTLRVGLDSAIAHPFAIAAGLVEISRRIDRTGTSTFRLNGRDVRRRDVQLLFADSASGSRSTALVKQGQIADLINASPIARSVILENAAGISGLQQRRHEAELKLDSTERNLERVNDHIEQLQKSHNILRRQAGQAKRYQKIADRMQEMEMVRLYRIWRDAEAAAGRAGSDHDRQRAALAGAETRLVGVRHQREESQAVLEPLLGQQTTTNDRLRQCRSDLEGHDGKARDAKRTIHTLLAQLGQIDKDLVRETELASDAGKSMERIRTEQVQLQESVVNFAGDIAAAKQRCAEAAEALSTCEREFDELNRAYIQAQTWQRQATEFREKNQQERDRLQTEIGALRPKITEARKVLRAMEDDATQQAADLEKAEASRSQMITALEEAECAYSECLSLLRVSESEAENLSGILEKEGQIEIQNIRSIRVDQGYEAALGAALGDSLFIGKADSEGAHGWLTLTDAPDVHALPEGIQSLKAYIDAPAWLDRRLGQIGITDWETAKSLQGRLQPGQRLVTLAGDVVRWDGLILSGKTMQGRAAQRLTQINRLLELEVQIETCRADTETRHQELEKARMARDEQSALSSDARRLWHESDRKLAEMRQSLATSEAALAAYDHELAAMDDRLARFQTEVADAQQNSQADRKGRLQSVDRQELEAAKTRAEKARRDFNERQMAAVTLQREHDSVGRCLKDMDGEIATWQKRNEQALSRIADLEKRREQIDREHRQASQLPDRLEEIRVTLLEAMAAQETAARDLADAIALAETRFQDVTKNEQDVSRQLQQVREDMVRFEMRHESARSDLAAAIEAIRETKSGTPEALAELVKSIDRIPESLSAIDEEIARLRHRRESIGAVNLRAVQDMQDLETEKASIVREKEELEAAIRKIRGSVANLNREGRSRLHDAFENVRKNFQRLFTSLFEGGTADLELIEGDDPLRSGLEIRCHPPGKRQTTLGLMSGGEQTLTSIALIFAFFLTNPAPVSVLDEIDAQLDDANVLRLCNLLDTMVRKTGTRFVIVTHNAVTMSRMSRLYGVTMQEKGVSQLVYVDLGEAERLAA